MHAHMLVHSTLSHRQPQIPCLGDMLPIVGIPHIKESIPQTCLQASDGGRSSGEGPYSHMTQSVPSSQTGSSTLMLFIKKVLDTDMSA